MLKYLREQKRKAYSGGKYKPEATKFWATIHAENIIKTMAKDVIHAADKV